jgi:SAM-dependent methyltransferase
MSDSSVLKRQRETHLDRHPDAASWKNRYFSASTLALWRAGSAAMAEHCRGRVLDAGSGRGAWRSTILARADACESVDLGPRGDDRPTWVGDLMDMPEVPSARYDTVVCHQVLEHLPEPGRALSEFRRVLVPGGTLIASAPHLSRLHELPHDYFRYTPNGMRALLERAGFADPEIRTYGGPLSFLHHQASFLFPGLLAGVPLLGTAALGINALFSVILAGIDRVPPFERLLPLGVLAIARKA